MMRCMDRCFVHHCLPAGLLACLPFADFAHLPYLQSHVGPQLDRLGHDRGGEGGVAHVEDSRFLGNGTHRLII